MKTEIAEIVDPDHLDSPKMTFHTFATDCPKCHNVIRINIPDEHKSWKAEAEYYQKVLTSKHEQIQKQSQMIDHLMELLDTRS